MTSAFVGSARVVHSDRPGCAHHFQNGAPRYQHGAANTIPCHTLGGNAKSPGPTVGAVGLPRGLATRAERMTTMSMTPLPADATPGPTPGRDIHLEDVLPFEDRFRSFYLEGPSNACWLWQGTVQKSGYGQIQSYGRSFFPHRVAWVLWSGQSLTDGLTIDHLCWNKLCVNPEHMELVSNAENLRRGQVRNPARGMTPAPGKKRAARDARACPVCSLVLHRGSMKYHLARVHEAA